MTDRDISCETAIIYLSKCRKKSNELGCENTNKAIDLAIEMFKKKEEEADYIRTLFDHRPYLEDFTLLKHRFDLLEIENAIGDKLLERENYDGIDFCDVGADGIQIRLHHKQISGITIGHDLTLKYDFSNKDEIINKAISEFIRLDNPKDIEYWQEFVRDGEKYGYD